MARNLCVLVLLLGAAYFGLAQDKDPVKEKLSAAKTTYDTALKNYRKEVGEWFDKREEVARKDGNKKAVDQIKAERAKFEEEGDAPKSLPATIGGKPALAKKTLEAAYAEAVKEYTKIRKDTEAAAVEVEGEAFKKEPVGAPVPGGTPALAPVAATATATAYSGRTGEAKAKLIKDGGGNEESEKAVSLGLAWLAKQQKQDGGWEYDQGMKEERVAATSMALLAFLGAGETHTDAKAKHKAVVKGGLDWLAKACPATGAGAGKMSNNMYAQGIGVIALCEAYGMTKDPKLKPVAQAAVDYIQRVQGPNGSWGYGPNANGDTSIVGWQVQALHAAKQAGLKVNDNVRGKTVTFLNFASGGAKKSVYGYQDNAGGAPGTALTAIGLLSRARIDKWGVDHPGMIDGVAGLVKNGPIGKGNVRNLYYYYYATQVVHFSGGEDWKNWNEGPKGADGVRKGGMRDWLVNEQNKKDGANLGSWDPEAGWFGTSCGRVGTTAMCVLTLEVYYRYPLLSADAPPVGKLPKDK